MARNDERDPRGLVGEACAALGLPEPSIGGAAIDASYIATRIQRYLIQHPYVRDTDHERIQRWSCGRDS